MSDKSLFRKRPFNLVTQEDILEIDNVILYAKGLVIHNKQEADRLETNQSLRNYNAYMKAKLNLDPTLSNYNKNRILNNYEEENSYYKNLYKKYGIDYVESRSAKDFQILKSTNKCLSENDEIMFKEAYYSALNYHLSVTYTTAFNNQSFNREFFETFLIFMAIQRYINLKMEIYFNVDRYNKYQLKNQFISNGLDYFDSFPIYYQRKLLKMLNNLIRNKGTDNVFDIILNVFGFKNIDIYKYYLVKENSFENINDLDLHKLSFYKTSYRQKLNVGTNKKFTFNEITENDPYWKSSYEEIANKDFNVANTKYTSVDVTMEILENTYKLANFISIILNEELNDKQDDSFYFLDSTISDSKINICNAIIALIALLMKFYGFKDTVNYNVEAINSVYGFNNINNKLNCHELINEIRKAVFTNKEDLSQFERENLEKFLNYFYFKNFDFDYEYSYEYIQKIFESKLVYKNDCYDFINQIESFGNSLGGEDAKVGKYFREELKPLLDDNNFTDFFDRVSDILYQRNLNIQVFEKGNYNYFNEILSIIVNHKYATNIYDINKSYDYLNLHNLKLQLELDSLILSNFTGIEEVYENYKLYKQELSNYKNAINELENDPNNALKKKNLEIKRNLTNAYLDKVLDGVSKNSQSHSDLSFFNPFYKYPVLKNYLNIFLSFRYIERDKCNIANVIEIFEHNQNIKDTLEKLILNTNNYKLFNLYNKLWELNFTTKSLQSILIKEIDDEGNKIYYNNFTEYLMDKDQNLYLYVTDIKLPTVTTTIYDVMVDRIFNLTQSIENFLNTKDDLFINNNYVGILTFIQRYVKILIKVFKAYTIELINSGSFIGLDRKLENSFKMFDDIGERDYFDKDNPKERHLNEFILVDGVTIEEIYSPENYLKMEDVLDIKEKITINVIDDDENINVKEISTDEEDT